MDGFIELIERAWPTILAIAVPLGAVIGFAIGFLVNFATLRKAVRERKKLDLEIDKLKDDAKDREAARRKLDLEIQKLIEEAARQRRADEKQESLVRTSDLMEMQALVQKTRDVDVTQAEKRDSIRRRLDEMIKDQVQILSDTVITRLLSKLINIFH